MHPIKTIKYRGHEIQIYIDDAPSNPRTEWDNLGTMVCCHSKYPLGDKQYSNSALIIDHYEEIKNNSLVLPLYLYDHGNITISTTPFSCPWDSGQIGFVYVTHEQIKKEWGNTSAETREKVKQCIVAEVETYAQYLTGQVYGYKINGPLSKDSCWGFYGLKNLDETIAFNLISEAKDNIVHSIYDHNKRKSKMDKFINNYFAL